MTGLSSIMIEAWQASLFLQGLEALIALGREILTKFCINLPLIEMGMLALIK